MHKNYQLNSLKKNDYEANWFRFLWDESFKWQAPADTEFSAGNAKRSKNRHFIGSAHAARFAADLSLTRQLLETEFAIRVIDFTNLPRSLSGKASSMVFIVDRSFVSSRN